MSVLCQAWTDCSVVEMDLWEHLFTQSWGIWMGSPKVWAPFLMIKQVEASAGDISRLLWLFCFPWTIYLERIFTEAAFPLCILAYMILSRCSENPRAYLSFPWNIFLILSRVFFSSLRQNLNVAFRPPRQVTRARAWRDRVSPWPARSWAPWTDLWTPAMTSTTLLVGGGWRTTHYLRGNPGGVLLATCGSTTCL